MKYYYLPGEYLDIIVFSADVFESSKENVRQFHASH